MARENILFVRNRPHDFNLGDFLCTPMHYFDFGCNEFQSRLFLRGRRFKTILGGGAYNDLGLSEATDPKNTVVWGIGSSHHGTESGPTNADALPYLLYGVRDPDAVSDPNKVLPCVTCLHPAPALPPGTGTSVFLNFGFAGTADARKHQLFSDGSVKLHMNNLSELAFMKAFAGSGRIVTNSFHVAYWSLLSGREVAIVGYSSKFRSLLKLVGLPPTLLHHYSVKDPDALMSLVSSVIRSGDFIKLPSSAELRAECIERNLRFADKCREIGFVAGYRLKSHRVAQMVLRMVKYRSLKFLLDTRRRLLH